MNSLLFAGRLQFPKVREIECCTVQLVERKNGAVSKEMSFSLLRSERCTKQYFLHTAGKTRVLSHLFAFHFSGILMYSVQIRTLTGFSSK